MAGTFTKGEVKVRPGTYFRYEKGEDDVISYDGTVCVLFQSNFGPLGQARAITPAEGYKYTYGDGGTTDVIREVIAGGATTIYCIRLGKGGTNANVTLNAGDTGKIVLKAKYPGSRDFKVSVRVNAIDTSLKELVIYSGTQEYEVFDFEATQNTAKVNVTGNPEDVVSAELISIIEGTDPESGSSRLSEEDNGKQWLVNALQVGASKSSTLSADAKKAIFGLHTEDVEATLLSDGPRSVRFVFKLGDKTYTFTVSQLSSTAPAADEIAAAVKVINDSSENFTAEGAGSGILDEVETVAFNAGTDPKITVEDYSKALEVAESYRYNAICVDSDAREVHLLVAEFLDRIFNVGQMAVGFIAENYALPLRNRIKTAAAYNDENMVYVLNAYVKENGKILKPYLVAARIAGMYAATPANKSLTHMIVDGWELMEVLTPSDYTYAETKGCLPLSTDPTDAVWIDYAINTLVTPAENQDKGWKKMRRTKTRYELMIRCNDKCDSLIGKVDNDANGRATIVTNLQGVCNTMVAEGKIVQATVKVDPNEVSDGDYAYFIIDVIDKDSIEHAYLTYKFRFSSLV